MNMNLIFSKHGIDISLAFYCIFKSLRFGGSW